MRNLKSVKVEDTPNARDSVVDSANEDGIDNHVNALIKQIGARVMQERKSQKLSRRELSERSGVSPRYLATLEAGDGNLSVSILKKLALALDTPVAFFLYEDDPVTKELQQLTDLYRQADPVLRTQVLQLLDPEHGRARKAQRLCLVGLRGAGKSTLGASIAEAFNAQFIELNTEIAESTGMPLGEIIALYGQEGYRQLEADILRRIIDSNERAVIAVAGGIVSAQDTFEHVLTRCHNVWVKASPVEHMERVRAQGDLRPMKGNPEAMTQLRELLSEREAHYAQADHLLDTSGKLVEESVAELSDLVTTHKMLG